MDGHDQKGNDDDDDDDDICLEVQEQSESDDDDCCIEIEGPIKRKHEEEREEPSTAKRSA